MKRPAILLVMVLASILPLVASPLPAPTLTYYYTWSHGVQLQWDRITGAATYTLFIDDQPKTRLITATASAPTAFDAQMVGVGYKWQVAAVRSDGEIGELSAPVWLTKSQAGLVGHWNVLVAFVTFTDYPTPPFPETDLDPLLTELTNWFNTESDGLFTVTFTKTAWRASSISLASLNPAFYSGGKAFGVNLAAMNAAMPLFPERTGYDTTVYILNGVGDAGAAGQGGVPLGAQNSATDHSRVLWTQEMGHNFGLIHTGRIQPVAPETSRIYENLLDPDPARWLSFRYASTHDGMGQTVSSLYTPYGAYKKVILGWAYGSDLRTAPPWGGTYAVYPVEDPLLHQTIGVVLPLEGIKGMFYLAEYHKNGAGTGDDLVVVYFHRPLIGDPTTQWGDDDLFQVTSGGIFGLSPGQTWTDSWRNIKVKFDGVVGEVASVTITTTATNPGCPPL